MMKSDFTLSTFFRKYSGLILTILFLFPFSVISQEEKKEEEKTTESKPIRLPIISAGIGTMNLSGDVGYGRFNRPLTARSGLQISIQQQTENRLSFGIFFLTGKMTGEEKTVNRALNFESTIFAQGLSLRYDFKSRKRSDQVLIPYLTAGIEYIFFNPRTDLLDANGDAYNYWSDGTIKDIAQGDVNAAQAVRIYRDYDYESKLTDADLDGFGKFDTYTFGIPVGVGVKFRMSNRCSIDFSSVCHFTGTDYIDGITSESKGNRQGNDKNDRIIYSSVAFCFALAPKENDEYKNIDFTALGNEDSDGDGIPDISDDSSGTPQNNPVDAFGKPYDKDKDGIPDYRDLEAESAIDAVVNEQGVTITEEMIEEKFRKDSLAALPAVIEYLKSYDKLTQRNPDVEKKWLEKNSAAVAASHDNPIPVIYRIIDLDKNAIITPKEISLAIDDYLAKKSSYTVSQFFDLIDFFFSQK